MTKIMWQPFLSFRQKSRSDDITVAEIKANEKYSAVGTTDLLVA